MLTFGIAYIRDFLNQFDFLGETFETSVPWSRIHDVTQAVQAELTAQCSARGVAGRPYLSYRVTQTYHTGVCIYFTMGFFRAGIGASHRSLSRHRARAAADDLGQRRLAIPSPRGRQNPAELCPTHPERQQHRGPAQDQRSAGSPEYFRHSEWDFWECVPEA